MGVGSWGRVGGRVEGVSGGGASGEVVRCRGGGGGREEGRRGRDKAGRSGVGVRRWRGCRGGWPGSHGAWRFRPERAAPLGSAPVPWGGGSPLPCGGPGLGARHGPRLRPPTGWHPEGSSAARSRSWGERLPLIAHSAHRRLSVEIPGKGFGRTRVRDFRITIYNRLTLICIMRPLQ